MNLRETQAALQRFILTQDDAAVDVVTGDDRLSGPDRLGIYAYAYISRLVESLQQTYPALARVLGDEQFARTAQAYVRENPSRVTSIRYYGRTFPEYLDNRANESVDAMLADLARWEWALAAAFDGPDSVALPSSDLGRVAADRWPALCLRLSGSLQRVTLQTNAVDWWRFAAQDAPQPEAADDTAATEWAIWRSDLKTSFRSLAVDEAWMLDVALRGASFSELCAGLVQFAGDNDAPLRAATLLKSWSVAGWVTGLEFLE